MQLSSPGFLWALMAVGIPILVHLLQLRRPQRVLFTNTSFIRDIEFKNGRRRLQDLLILVLRILTVVFLVAAFCQPIIPLGIGGSDRAAQVVVDNSVSMQRPGQQQERIEEQAVTVAKEIGRSYGADTKLRLLGHSKKPVAQGLFEQVVGKLPTMTSRIGWGAPVMRRAFQASGGEVLYVVSDFQKSELPPVELRRQFAGGRRIVLAPQVGRAAGNIYVDSVWLNDGFVRAGASVGIHVRLHNGGDETVRDCPVKVLLDGRQVAAYQTSVSGGQSFESAVQIQVPDQALVEGLVHIADLPVTFDNQYYFALRPAKAIQVVEIGPLALTQAAYRGEPLFRYNYMPSRQVDFGRLRQANLVLLDEAATVDAGLREALLGVIQRGGSVAVVPSAQAMAREPTEQLLRELGVGGVQWEPRAGEPVRQELVMPDARSSFFKEVFGAQPRQASMPSASPVLRLTNGGTDVLRLRDGDGFLTEFSRGAGRVYVFAAPFDKAYSDFTSHSLFVPVLYRLAMLSYRDDQPLAYRIGPTSLTLQVPKEAIKATDAVPYRLVRDSLTLVPAQRQQGQQLRLEIPSELTQPGFYQLQRQGRTVATLAFNTPKAESELAAYSVAELRQLLGDRPNVQVLDTGQQPAALRDYRAGQASRPLWRYCLLLALACLLAEGAVLRWGRRTGPLASGVA